MGPRSECAYACYDLGLLLKTSPDTVRFPAMSIFCSGERFSESDKSVTEGVPEVVVELASTSDRRALYPERATGYLQWGVLTVWVIDPQAKSLSLFTPSEPEKTLSVADVLDGTPWLQGFRITMAELFVEPEWWTGQSSVRQPK